MAWLRTGTGDMVSRAPSRLRRWLPLAGLLATAAVLHASGVTGYLTPDALRVHHADLARFVADHRLAAALAYVLIYVLATAASIPGGLVLTISGGILFGTGLATVLTVIGASAGATAIFLIARTALGPSLRQRVDGRLGLLAEGCRRNAFSYLLGLRLVPLVPFFVANLAPAFLGVSLRTYVLATVLGIIPGSFVYASVGAGLAELVARGGTFSTGDILTPPVMLGLSGLAFLAVLPALWRRFSGERTGRPMASGKSGGP